MNEQNPFVCVIDDESSMRESLSNLLRSAGLKVQVFASAQEFLADWPQEPPSCLVLDIRLPGISGLDLQHELAGGDAQIPIIFMTGYGDIPMTVRAMKAGAIEFLTKPFHDGDLLSAVDQAIKRGDRMEQAKNRSAQKLLYPEGNRDGEINFPALVGNSSSLRNVLQQVETVAPSDSTVLILGETGTGKELIASAVHRRSRRRDKPMIRVNCTSIPRELFESEFFGHAKGAFTGAHHSQTYEEEFFTRRPQRSR
jgi:DNA-binding NtrC family response regulator